MSQIPPPPMSPNPEPNQGPNYQRGAQDAVTAAKAAAQDAFKVFMQLIYNPVGAMPSAFASLSSTQAMTVGGVFAAVFTVCLLCAFASLSSTQAMAVDGVFAAVFTMWLLLGGTGMLGMAGIPSMSFGFKEFATLLLVSFGFAAGVAAGNYLTRLAFKAQGSLSFDIFSGGAALLPLGLGLLATTIVGLVGVTGSIGSVPSMIGGCLMVLVLFTGLTRVAQINEGPASYSVGAILVVGLIAAYLVGRVCFKLFYGF